MGLNAETVRDAFAEYLQPGEMIKHAGYGVKQPSMILIMLLYLVAVLPGIIAMVLLTKHYLVGITDSRLLVLQVSGMNTKVKEVTEYNLGHMPPVKTSTGPLFTHLTIVDSDKPLKAKFHRAGFKGNRDNMVALTEILQSNAERG
jgi:hypothetical protein